MNRRISVFPTLSEKARVESQYRIENLEVKFSKDPDIYGVLQLELDEDNSNIYLLKDETGSWSPNENDLIIDGELQLGNPAVLFGEGGIAPNNGLLSVSLVWNSKLSKQRGAKVLAVFNKDSGSMSLPFSVKFEKATLRGALDIAFVLAVGLDNSVDNRFAKIKGTVLGELVKYSFIIEGSGSTFTVLEKNETNGVLWTIECNWDDPESDLFTETVRIIINKAHPAWKLTDNLEYKKQILKEIMASSIQVVLTKLDKSQYSGESEYDAGSVSAAMYYLVQKAELGTDTPEDIAVSIRRYLDKVMK